jgi:hypothetical protein
MPAAELAAKWRWGDPAISTSTRDPVQRFAVSSRSGGEMLSATRARRNWMVCSMGNASRASDRSRGVAAIALSGRRDELTRRLLPAEKGLTDLSGPWTLFVYAMEGSHGRERVATVIVAPIASSPRGWCRSSVPTSRSSSRPAPTS